MSSANEESIHYYGISVSDECRQTNQLNVKDLVLTDINEALSIVKKYKGSRFKNFNSIDDAINFVENRTDFEECGLVLADIEKQLCAFSSPHPRDLAILRKTIEKGDIEEVKRIIWSNPRYLVNVSDTPVILMEGPRYNACHIAAKLTNHYIIKLILDTVSDTKFMQLLYPKDEPDITNSRIKYLLDNYLNTPDKGLNESPLHFACKFGNEQTVKVLLSFPTCDTNIMNKSGLKAIDIVCQRKGDNGVKEKIDNLFESRIYVPLILDDDLSVKVGKPVETKDNRIEDNRIKGLAGPMSPQQASKLYSTLKSPHKCTPQQLRIRLTDSEKGLQKIARNLCNEMDVNWTEFD